MPPPVYFERLTGLRVGRSGKPRCLFHDDRVPSLHVYREPERGWYCFGCGRVREPAAQAADLPRDRLGPQRRKSRLAREVDEHPPRVQIADRLVGAAVA
ncbi:MAG: CHC2 zinc finger domain-containing protein [Solirubrobacteraceae bacterium]